MQTVKPPVSRQALDTPAKVRDPIYLSTLPSHGYIADLLDRFFIFLGVDGHINDMQALVAKAYHDHGSIMVLCAQKRTAAAMDVAVDRIAAEHGQGILAGMDFLLVGGDTCSQRLIDHIRKAGGNPVIGWRTGKQPALASVQKQLASGVAGFFHAGIG
jgi:hypothetical protein